MNLERNKKQDPQGDLQCVWVKAGVLSSKICDMEFDCDHCSLDADIRQTFHKPEAGTERTDLLPRGEAPVEESDMIETREKLLEALFQRLEQFSLRDDRYYFPAHTWVQDGHRLTVTIGIDDFGARLLPHTNSVVFPLVRSYIHQGEYCAWLVGPEGAIALASPVSGTIVRVNDALYAMPNLVRTSPYERGWLSEIIPDRFYMDKRKLLLCVSANRRFRKDIERLRRQFFLCASADLKSIGKTLFDGGRYVENVQTLIGFKRYVELIYFLFRP